MDKIKKLWDAFYAPMLFFIGAGVMFTGSVELGALYIFVATNEVMNK